MTAKTANNILHKKDVEVLHAMPVKSGQVIYQDTLVGIGSDGLLANITAENVATLRIVGVVADDSSVKPPAATGANGSLLGDRASEDNGNKTIRQVWLHGRFLLDFVDTLTQADLGKLAYARNNNDCSVSAAQGVLIGTIVGIESAGKAWVDLNKIMPSYPDQDVAVVRGALVAATTSAVGGVISVANPFAAPAQVESMMINIATASTGAATLDVGIGTDTTSDILLDGVVLNGSVTGLKTIGTDGGINGKAFRPIKSTEKVIGTASATVAGLVGTYNIVFRKF